MAESSSSSSLPPPPAEDEKHIKSHEQFKAVVDFIVDNHHAVKELNEFCKNFTLTEQDHAEIEKMAKEEEPIFMIVHEILQRHHKNSGKPPTLKSVAEIFTKMGLQHLADDIEALWDAEEIPNPEK